MNGSPSKTTRISIVALAADIVQGQKEKCLEADMDDYLGKPIYNATLGNVTNIRFNKLDIK
ncbi:MAG: hypothetical protein RIF33_25845 [Cyclobacteriaceae bacterium]